MASVPTQFDYQFQITKWTNEIVGQSLDSPDRRDGAVYEHDDKLILAVEVALATGRPLLLRGKPGSGKSSLAAWIARNLGWRYYEQVISARTRGQDLLYTYDSVQRLSDAQARVKDDPPLDRYAYISPGALWWGLNRESALQRGASKATDATATEPNEALNNTRSSQHAVVLLDEIDKADPDVPSSLLVPLGSLLFHVAETNDDVMLSRGKEKANDAARLLLIITTNEERELPDALLRRCIIYELRSPDPDKLVRIAALHFGGSGGKLSKKDEALARGLASRIKILRDQAEELGIKAPSTAEFLDAMRACKKLGVTIKSPKWKRIERLTLRKRRTFQEPTDNDEDPGG